MEPGALRQADRPALGAQIDSEHRPAGYDVTSTFHPTFLYEFICDLAGVGILLLLDRRFRFRPPALFALYVSLYTLGASSRSCCGSTPRTTSAGCA